ncbi:MAG: 16S rRNA (cytidine(1402)-2'-O)-methyltransferase [Acidobacteria bacterium]|nr:16S rRNA (cytidine(1402)-2'-O)-methyltransferase [Acidobacteriota bacterium]
MVHDLAGPMPGTLYVVATPIGNLEDITFRAVRILREVDLIAAEDTRRTSLLLRHHHVETPVTSFHEHNERQKLPHLLSRLRSGASLAVVSDAGTPAVSDPGYRLVRACLDERIRVSPIPGPSAPITALVASGLPTDSFVFLGYPPARQQARMRWLNDLKDRPETLLMFEAPHRIRATLADSLSILGDRHICVARELTKLHEELLTGPISEILMRLPEARGEFTLVMQGAEHDQEVRVDVSDDQIATEIGLMTKDERLSRRDAARRLARKYGLSPNEIYARAQRAAR